MRKIYGEPALEVATRTGAQLYYQDQAVTIEDARSWLARDPGGVSCEGDPPCDADGARAPAARLPLCGWCQMPVAPGDEDPAFFLLPFHRACHGRWEAAVRLQERIDRSLAELQRRPRVPPC